ncbi:hypothetical protein J1N35_005709 [Gossypium stocksii]|uniref:Uncharacterized protein n=1 Tax=Gossypium stocksii TaxID=47602 RepID=A0A9D3WDF5_9ROSI|nr:hypothetical protein J1N35_005709 [Gossypium stocksii]
MGKAYSDRHLAVFAFVVYGLIVFPKALGYVTVELVDFLFHIEKGVRLIGIWGAINYSSLMVLSQYGYDQCVLATAGSNKVEVLVQDPRFLKKLEEIRIKWGQDLSLQSGTFFNHFPLETYIQWCLKRSKISLLAQFKGKRKVLDNVAELTEKIRNLEMHLRGKDEEVRRQREQHQAYVKEMEEEIMRQ